MKCKDCDRFCRFPKNQSKGLCAERVSELVEGINPCKVVIVDENENCYLVWAKPQGKDKQ